MEESLSLYEAPGPHISTTIDHGDAYVLSLANLPTVYAALASSPSNKIDLLDKRSLRRIRTLPGHDSATTSIHAVDNVVGIPYPPLLSSGKDGSVKVWDDRSGSHAIRLTDGGNYSRGLLCCDVSSDGRLIAAGTELQGEDAFIMYWDPRQPAAPLYSHPSTHSDDITTVSFHPSALSFPLVLSGSSDGLLTISNATNSDEDEAVLHVTSWGASISQAGWFHSSANNTSFGIWAASDMESFSLWSDELDQQLSLDIRSPSVHTRSRTWVTDYLITSTPSHQGDLRVYVGSNEGDAALITPPAISSPDPLANSIGSWTLHSLWQGHHIGIVRSILPDDENQVIVTGGEDGMIHLWKNIPLNSSAHFSTRAQGLMDVDEDSEMSTPSKVHSPAARACRKRNRYEDEILTGKKSRYQ